MVKGIRFKKTGTDIKAAAKKRLDQLQERLIRRDASLDEFLKDRSLVCSYLVRAIGGRIR